MHPSLCLLVLAALCARAVSGGCSPKYAAVADLPAHFYQATGQNSLPKGKRLSRYSLDAYRFVNTTGTYKYYGMSYKKITVDVNGVLIFGHKLPPMYPVHGYHYYHDMIAAFWAATDTTRCGDVFWQETQDQTLLNRFRTSVDKSYNTQFTPTHIFMVTYFNVDQWWAPCCTTSKRDAENEQRPGDDGKPAGPDHFEMRAASSAGLNSYQTVIATDGTTTFAMLNYADPVGWTDSPYSMAGFWTDYGGKTYFSEKSYTTGMSQLPNHGGSVKGQYIYQVNSGNTFIQNPYMFKRWP